MLHDLMKMIFHMVDGPIEEVARTEAGGLTVSTVLTGDMGYETAVLDDSGHAFPVEMYPDRDAAVAGHERWVGKAPSLTAVDKLPYGSLPFTGETVVLRRNPPAAGGTS